MLKSQKRPTLAAVASRAGVAVATASYALKNNPKIPAPTRERVRRAARALSYVLDPEIGRLMHLLRKGRPVGQKCSIALLSFAINRIHPPNYYRKVLMTSAARRCEEMGYNVEELELIPGKMTPHRLTGVLSSRGIQGILIPPMASRVDCSALAEWGNFSVIAATYTALNLNVNRVVPNNLQNGCLALQKLGAKGFKRIGLVTEPCNHARINYNFAYWVAPELYRQEGRLAPLPILEFEGPSAFRTWCQIHAPDAILATEERLAASIATLMEQERLIQRPIAVLNNSLNRRFSGVYPFPEIIGKIAADNLSSQIQRGERGIAEHPTITMVEGTWIDAKVGARQ